MSASFADVALPLPVDSPYTYRVPEALAGRAVPGARVAVPLRRGELVGIVLARHDRAPEAVARDLLDAPDAAPILTDDLLRCARWMARYYGAPLGLAVRAMLPGPFWSRARAARPLRTDAAVRRERVVALTGEPPTLLERERIFARAARQRALYETLEALGGRAPLRHLERQLGFAGALAHALAARGLARLVDEEASRDPFAGLAGAAPPAVPTPAQEAAVAAIAGAAPGHGVLLEGVTGSGKTLVYLEAVRACLARGEGAIVLVPEIALTPQTVQRFRGAFGDQVAVLHSGLSDGERADAWRLLARGERRVAVGARSAVFAPVAPLGLVVLDEEHEASYKNGEAPRYHAREVARVRARLTGARLVLGSATPSLDSAALVGDRLAHVRLPARIGDRPLPPVELVDLRRVPTVREAGPVPWSVPLDAAVGAALAAGDQVLLLLNRRGFASFLQCGGCGAVAECPHCSVALTVHATPAGLRCHHCGHARPRPEACTACGQPMQAMRGVGTQQLEQWVAARFPHARLARMDLDTTSGKWGHDRILGAVARGEADILLGTQMIAKGLDFPRVTLVGVVDADAALHLPDFRAAERTFQLIAQVAGRAGRGERGGRVLVQTRSPAHHALVHAARHDAPGFRAEELALRRSPPYPPAVALVNLVASAADELAASRRAAEVADWCAGFAARAGLALAVLGPAPCPLARLKDRWRWHVLVRGAAADVGRLVRSAARRLAGGEAARVTIDRDPVSLL